MADRNPSRGDIWFDILTQGYTYRTGQCASIRVADGQFAGKAARIIAVVPDPDNHYPRAAGGEVGLLEGWTLGKVVAETVDQDREKPGNEKRAIIAIIDVPSQAYGRREEAFGIHLALSAAAGAYATARLAGHPVIGLIVGKAMSGAFLAHGYQANRLIAFNDSGVLIHAMGKASAARITKRTVDSLTELASTIPPMAYDIANYAKLGLLENLLDIANPTEPTTEEIGLVIKTVSDAIDKARISPVTLNNRLGSPYRAGTTRVFQMMREQWSA